MQRTGVSMFQHRVQRDFFDLKNIPKNSRFSAKSFNNHFKDCEIAFKYLFTARKTVEVSKMWKFLLKHFSIINGTRIMNDVYSFFVNDTTNREITPLYCTKSNKTVVYN
jgi:hypothetical protein